MNNDIDQLDVSASEEGEQAQAIAMIRDAQALDSVRQKLAKQRRESADIYQSQNRQDLYQIEQEELQVIEAYLPKQLDKSAVAGLIKEIIKPNEKILKQNDQKSFFLTS